MSWWWIVIFTEYMYGDDLIKTEAVQALSSREAMDVIDTIYKHNSIHHVFGPFLVKPNRAY